MALSVILACMGVPLASIAAFADDDASTEATVLYSGELGNSDNSYAWSIDSEGVLTIEPPSGSETGILGAGDWYSSGGNCPWFSYRSTVTSVVVASGVMAGTSLYCTFYGLTNVTSITFPETFDTSDVTTMFAFFGNCGSLATLDVSMFDTSNVTTMARMFWSCSSLTSLDLTSFDTSGVTTMQYMFYGCSSLSSVDVSSFDASSVVYMDYMFANCSALTALDLSMLDTPALAYMKGIFSGDASLAYVDLSSVDTSSTASNSGAYGDEFSGCTGLRTLIVGEGYKFRVGGYPPSPVDDELGTGCWRNSAGDIYDDPTDIPSNVADTYTAIFGDDMEPVITEECVELSADTFVCDGAKKTPEVTVTYDGVVLTEDRHYTVEMSSGRRDIGEYTVTVTGGTNSSKNYSGTVTKTFAILGELTSATLSATSYAYDGKAHTPAVTVKYTNPVSGAVSTLAEGTDYSVGYSADTRKAIGTYEVTVTGMGSYTGTVTKTYKIRGKISSVKLSKTSYVYTGKKLKPSVTVKYNGKKLKQGTDYTLTYSKNKAIGTATVKVVGKGSYTGTLTKTFTIKPGKASVGKAKSPAAGKLSVKCSLKKKGGASYQIAYKAKGGSWKRVKTGSASKVLKGLASGKTYTVKVRACKKVGGKTYYGSWSGTKKVKVR